MNRSLVFLTACLMVLVLLPWAHAQTNFRHVLVDAAGPANPWGKSIGDMNGDGRIDLLVGGNQSGGLVYYENPNWQRQVIAPAGRWSTDHEPVDLDGDGDLDVVALTTNELCWLENPGWKQSRIARIVLHDIEVADFDRDGDLDIVGRDQGEFGHSGERLHFFRQEDIVNWTHREIPCPNGEGLATSDVDRDNDIDILINTVWFENPGSILEADWRQHQYAERWLHAATFVAPVDINQDGRVDLVLSPSELAGQNYRISWFEAPTNPRDIWTEHPVELNVEAVHHFVGAADFDLDGDMDIVSAEMHQGQDPDAVKLYLNAGDHLTWQRTVIADSGSHSMRLVDIDNDGDFDLFGANHQGTQVDLWVNQCNQPASAKQTRIAPSNTWTYLAIDSSRTKRCFGIASGDIDGDGDQDLAVGDTLYHNPGENMAGKWMKSQLSTGSDANWITDVDADGRLDIIAQNLPNILWQEPQNGLDSFHSQIVVGELGQTGHGSSQGFAHGDMNGDGRDDYVLTSGNGIHIVLIPQDPQRTPWENFHIANNSPEEGIALADIDHDGRIDVVAWIGSGSGSQRLGWWRNIGLASDLSWPYYEIGQVDGKEGDRVVVGDLNGDGNVDVAATGTTNEASGSVLCWFANPGQQATSGWQKHEIADDMGAMNSLAIADLDADGQLDLVSAEHRGQLRTTIWHNIELGSEWQPQHIAEGIEGHLGTHLSDLDNDGDLDLVSIGWDHYQTLHLWRNDGPSSP